MDSISIVSTRDLDHEELLYELCPEEKSGTTASVKNASGITKEFRCISGTWVEIKKHKIKKTK